MPDRLTKSSDDRAGHVTKFQGGDFDTVEPGRDLEADSAANCTRLVPGSCAGGE